MAVTRADKVVELEQLEKAFKGSDSAILVGLSGRGDKDVAQAQTLIKAEPKREPRALFG